MNIAVYFVSDLYSILLLFYNSGFFGIFDENMAQKTGTDWNTKLQIWTVKRNYCVFFTIGITQSAISVNARKSGL